MKTFRFEYTYEADSYEDEQFSRDYDFPVQSNIKSEFEFDDDCSWMTVMEQFVSFLGSVYGYDIHDDVQYKDFDTKLKEVLGPKYDD